MAENDNTGKDDSRQDMKSKNSDNADKRRYVLGRDYRSLKIRRKNYKDGVLLTNDYGKWLFLSKKEYDNFVFDNLDDTLFKKLEDNFMLMTDDNMQKISHQINDYYWYLNQGTTLHIIVPTLRCNLTCKYCYAFREPLDKKDKDMTPETVDKTIDFVFKSPSNIYSIEFTGGEPLLRFDLVKRAIEKAEKLGKEKGKKVSFSIITNGLYLTKEMIDYCYKHKVGLCLSLDGPKELHNKNRRITEGNKDSYDKVVEKIDLLKEEKFPSVNTLPVIVKDSLKMWKEIVDEYVGLGFNVLRFKYVSRFGFASKAWDQMSYSAEEYLEAWKNVIDYMIELNKKGVQISENIATIIIQKLITGINSGYAELQIPCGAVIGQVVYDYDGSIFTCDEARTMEEFKIGDVFTSEYKDLLSCPVTKTLQTVSDLTRSCDECPWFVFCGICPLEIYNEEKGFISNIPANYRCKIHKGMFEFLFDKIIHDEEAKKMLYRWPYLRKGIVGSSEKEEGNKNIFLEN